MVLVRKLMLVIAVAASMPLVGMDGNGQPNTTDGGAVVPDGIGNNEELRARLLGALRHWRAVVGHVQTVVEAEGSQQQAE